MTRTAPWPSRLSPIGLTDCSDNSAHVSNTQNYMENRRHTGPFSSGPDAICIKESDSTPQKNGKEKEETSGRR